MTEEDEEEVTEEDEEVVEEVFKVENQEHVIHFHKTAPVNLETIASTLTHKVDKVDKVDKIIIQIQ